MHVPSALGARMISAWAASGLRNPCRVYILKIYHFLVSTAYTYTFTSSTMDTFSFQTAVLQTGCGVQGHLLNAPMNALIKALHPPSASTALEQLMMTA